MADRVYEIDGVNLTPDEFRELSREQKLEAMITWFYSNYEDPVHRTSYNGREGGYLWNHGGPYDADSELQGEFSDIADLDLIQDAVEEVTSDGIFEWAPTPSSDDYDQDFEDVEIPASPPTAGTSPGFLTTENGDHIVDERGNRFFLEEAIQAPAGVNNLKQEMFERLDAFEALLRQHVIQNAPNRGHNNPPELIDDDHFVSQEQSQEVAAAIAEIRREAGSENPDAAVVKTQASILGRFGGWLLGIIGVAGTIKDGVELVTSAWQQREALYQATIQAVEAVNAYVNSLPLPF
ncbi:hypothetical protein D7027_05310 [Ochrobactrum intermedium]|uniref:hypothetical protein n=1 Tax=Brucella intermedia TaxID=94625 RepID=UPI00128B4AA1|nr:hypothetical protein [Brucella intermedia]MPR61238.1 hypothetical protein [Brucella intermedia]